MFNSILAIVVLLFICIYFFNARRVSVLFLKILFAFLNLVLRICFLLLILIALEVFVRIFKNVCFPAFQTKFRQRGILKYLIFLPKGQFYFYLILLSFYFFFFGLLFFLFVIFVLLFYYFFMYVNFSFRSLFSPF